MAWTASNPVSIGMATKKSHYDALWDNCDMFKTQHATDGTHAVVTATSVTPANLTASLPVFTDGSKKLVSKSVADTLTALGVGAWTDYSATSTVTGWAAGKMVSIWYKVVEKIVFVMFTISGISNDSVASFTVPTAASVGVTSIYGALGESKDNGVYTVDGKFQLSSGTSLVSCFKDHDYGSFTSSGTKTVAGFFFYPIA